jgi:hypothetical protein
MLSVDSIKTSQTVTIPGWCGEAVEVELTRPSILALAAAGAITNPLLKTARRIFYAGLSPDGGDLAEEGRVLLEIAKAALVKPAFHELETAGIALTDEQLVAIFQFTQLGAKALDRFRGLSAGIDGDIRGAEVSD